MKKSIIMLLTAAAVVTISLAGFAKAEEHTVTGIVTTTDGQTITSATVNIKFTDKEVYTGLMGEYKIAVPLDSTLVFSFPDFKTKEVKVTGDTINVVLDLM